jgi:hypothetical protein
VLLPLGGGVKQHCTGRGLRRTRPVVYGRSALVDHGRASRSASGGTQLAIAAGLVHVDITQGTADRRGGELTGGDCLPAESRGGQRGVGGGKGIAVAFRSTNHIASAVQHVHHGGGVESAVKSQ